MNSFFFFLSVTLATLIFSLQPQALAQNLSVMEGFDRQSLEEIEKANQKIEDLFRLAADPESLSEEEKQLVLSRYQHVDLRREIPQDLREQALLYFDLNRRRFSNRQYLAIMDYRIRSDFQRLFIVNLKTGRIEKFRSTHGWGSDENVDGFAEQFSNRVGSGMSSLGYARTGEVYSGKFKRSLRLDGLSPTNSKLRARAVVIHGWDDIKEEPFIPGLSWGCLALDWKVKDSIIDRLQDGALLLMAVSKTDD